MRLFSKKINWRIPAAMAMLVFALIGAHFISRQPNDTSIPFASAGDSHNLRGFAWSENFGWVSFNSLDCDRDGDGTIQSPADDPIPTGCPSGATADYGVNIADNGHLSGHAWSQYAGWIAFEQPMACANGDECVDDSDCDTGFTPCASQNAPDYNFNIATLGNCSECKLLSNCIACMNSSKEIYGWAKVLALGNDGWMSLRGTWDDGGGNSGDYGLSMEDNGELTGYAWNGNTTAGVGLGWLSVNASNCDTPDDPLNNQFDAGDPIGCPASGDVFDYRVTSAIAAETLTALSAEPDPSDRCHRLIVRWNDIESEDNYHVYGNLIEPVGMNAYCNDPLGQNITECATVTNAGPGETRFFKVRATNALGHVDSNVVFGTTYQICDIDTSGNDDSATGQCPSSVQLNWPEPDTGIGCTIAHYEVARCKCDTAIPPDCSNCVGVAGVEDISALPDYNLIDSTDGGGCVNPIVNGCLDSILTSEKTDRFQYSVRSQCDTNEYSSWSQQFPDQPTDSSEGVIPCPKKPIWEEDKAQ